MNKLHEKKGSKRTVIPVTNDKDSSRKKINLINDRISKIELEINRISSQEASLLENHETLTSRSSDLSISEPKQKPAKEIFSTQELLTKSNPQKSTISLRSQKLSLLRNHKVLINKKSSIAVTTSKQIPCKRSILQQKSSATLVPHISTVSSSSQKFLRIRSQKRSLLKNRLTPTTENSVLPITEPKQTACKEIIPIQKSPANISCKISTLSLSSQKPRSVENYKPPFSKHSDLPITLPEQDEIIQSQNLTPEITPETSTVKLKLVNIFSKKKGPVLTNEIENSGMGHGIRNLVDLDLSTSRNAYASLRNKLIKKAIKVQVPNSAWCMSRNEKSNTLLFFYGDAIQNPFEDNKLHGLATKILHLRDDKLIFWMQNKNIKLPCNDKPATVEELEHVLQQIDSYKTCCSGPFVNEHPTLALEAGYGDKYVWTHQDYPILLEKEKICVLCTKVYPSNSEPISKANQASIVNKIADLTFLIRNGRDTDTSSIVEGSPELPTLPKVENIDILTEMNHELYSDNEEDSQFSNEPTIICENCNMELRKTEMKKHLDSCNLTNSRINRELNLQTQGQIFKCKDCGKVFRRNCDLTVHISRVHCESVDCPFPKCTTKIKKNYLSQHIRLKHKKQKQNAKQKCSNCHRYFLHGSISGHIKMCSSYGPRPFECTKKGCDRRFKTTHERTKHVNEVHSKKINCPFGDCNTVMRKKYLNKHLRNIHYNMEETCIYCESRIPYGRLASHVKECQLTPI